MYGVGFEVLHIGIWWSRQSRVMNIVLLYTYNVVDVLIDGGKWELWGGY